MSKERIVQREEDRKQKEEVKIQDIIEKESKPVEHEHKHNHIYCVFLQTNQGRWEELVKVFRNEKDADNYIQSITPVVHYKLQFELE